MRPRKLLAVLLLALGLLSLGGSAATARSSDTGPIDIVEVEGLIDPPMGHFILSRMQEAAAHGTQVVILRLDSPASVGVDRAAIESAIQDSPVPVIAWVAPRGATAEGLAADLFAAADDRYRADDTTIAGSSSAEVESASSLEALLQVVDGRTYHGTSVETWDQNRGFPDVLIRFQGLPVWDRVLHAATTPTAALFLILLGAFGFVFETYNPGIGIAAALGFVLLALGFYALDVLPTNWWALLIITASLVALIYDVHVAGFGPFTVGGLIGVALGSALLFPGGVAALDVHLFAIVAAVLLTILFFVSVMTAALRVRLRRPIDDSDGIVGSIAEAHTDIAPEGTVMSNGTLWRARTMETGIAAGARVQVKATEGLVLLVEPLHEE